MLRRLLLYLSSSDRIRHLVMNWGPSRRVAERFVAGVELERALEVVRQLSQAGFVATVDHLGEHVETGEQADRAAEDYIQLVDAIDQHDLPSGISLKLTQLGLTLDLAACVERVARIAERAEAHNLFVRIDMEESQVVGDTLKVIQAITEQGLRNIGAVIQSYLRRSESDARSLLSREIPIRLVKGAYDEPAAVAYPDKADVDRKFDHLATLLIETAAKHGRPPSSYGGRYPPIPAIATHDDKRIEFAQKEAERIRLPREELEFQFLYGIRPELQREVAEAGYPVRIYVPYGSEWYAYFMRRLAERPANLWFFLSNLFRR